jgi:prolyl-tRNA synthetase
MATIVEVSHDDKGIIWPEEVAPYQVSLINLGHTTENIQQSDDIYAKLTEKGIEVLYDDRETSAGEKFADCDLIGLPVRLIVSEKTNGKIEFKKRNDDKPEILTLEEVLGKLSDE